MIMLHYLSFLVSFCLWYLHVTNFLNNLTVFVI